MNNSTLSFKNVLILTAISCTLFGQSAHAKSFGVFALFEAKNDNIQSESIDNMEKKVASLGCALRREGKILAVQGNYEMPVVDSFFFLECESSFLKNANSQSVIEDIKHSTGKLTLLEGPVSQFGSFGLAKQGRNNSYLFKLGDYNNVATKQRNRDLMTLESLVKTRKDRYKTEAFVRVEDARGMKRPDEVVVIYYDSAESGKRFRGNDNNNDIMKLIGKFNKDHLTQASYLVAQSNR